MRDVFEDDTGVAETRDARLAEAAAVTGASRSGKVVDTGASGWPVPSKVAIRPRRGLVSARALSTACSMTAAKSRPLLKLAALSVAMGCPRRFRLGLRRVRTGHCRLLAGTGAGLRQGRTAHNLDNLAVHLAAAQA